MLYRIINRRMLFKEAKRNNRAMINKNSLVKRQCNKSSKILAVVTALLPW